jgi:hypothetical protein
LSLLQHAANLGGSDVTWNTVLDMYPLPRPLSPELIINNPYVILKKASKFIIPEF